MDTGTWGLYYNYSWWGNAIQTAPSVIGKPNFFASQFAMNDRQKVEAIKCIADWIHNTQLSDV